VAKDQLLHAARKTLVVVDSELDSRWLVSVVSVVVIAPVPNEQEAVGGADLVVRNY
jgi:hypothetical protein